MACSTARRKERYRAIHIFALVPNNSRQLLTLLQELDKSTGLDLLLCTVRVPVEGSNSKKPIFELMTPGQKKPMVLRAEAEMERQDWMKAIQEAVSISINAQNLYVEGPP